MFNSYVIEVPNTNIREERTSLDECWDICYDLAQEYGLAEVVFYALNGNRVVQGSYTDACLLYTSPSPRDLARSRMPSSA